MMALFLAAGLGVVALASTVDPLDPYEGEARVLAVVAPDASDPRMIEQRKLYAAMGVGARERDLVLVEGIGQSARAQALRQRLGTAPAEFRAVLIGKDGGEKLSSATPIGPDRLFPLIDSMPMRQDEMRRIKPTE